MSAHELGALPILLCAACTLAQTPGLGAWDLRWCSAMPIYDSVALAYDETRDRVVAFGGNHQLEPARTWEWDGIAWLDVTPTSGSPPKRLAHAMAYDPVSQAVLLFGGLSLDLATTYADTWEWNGIRWLQRHPEQGPGCSPPQPPCVPHARHAHAMVTDHARSRIVLFGGGNRNAPPSQVLKRDTWEWDGIRWREVVVLAPPGPRISHALAYDGLRRRVVLFGGAETIDPPANPNQWLRDAWEWDGTGWTQICSPCTPSARYGHVFSETGIPGRLVLFGNSLETLELDGSTWGTVPTACPPPWYSPPPLIHLGYAFDRRRGKVVAFGGKWGNSVYADTWEYHRHDESRHWDYVGCGHCQPLPPPPSPDQRRCAAWLTSNGSYRLGETLVLRVRNHNITTGTTWFLLSVGLCARSSGEVIRWDVGVCIPGAPGNLFLIPQLVVPISGDAMLTQVIPEEPSIIGVPICVQAGSHEVTTCFRLSNAIRVTIAGL